MRVAIVHEWLLDWAGSERVLEQIVACFPDANLFVLADFLSAAHRGKILGKRAMTSFIQRLPFARKHLFAYFPLMPLAIEQLDLSGYDLVISSSHAVAKGVIVAPDQLHISYVHSPMRYAWDQQHQYLRGSQGRGFRGLALRMLLHYLRNWDARSANGVDVFVANSHYVAGRIRKAYRRESEVVYPPVDIGRFGIGSEKDDFFLCAGRMMPYKRVDVIVDAFTEMRDKKLVVIGDGPEYKSIRARAGRNVLFLGYQSDETLIDYLQRSRALVFAAEEDFGILPVEAQASGTPVIAFGRGGALETIRAPRELSPTGLFFYEQTPAAVVSAVEEFERNISLFSPAACRANAERFSSARFREELTRLIRRHTAEWEARRALRVA